MIKKVKIRVMNSRGLEKWPYEKAVNVMGAVFPAEVVPPGARTVGIIDGEVQETTEECFSVGMKEFCNQLRKQGRHSVVDFLKEIGAPDSFLGIAFPKSACEVISQ